MLQCSETGSSRGKHDDESRKNVYLIPPNVVFYLTTQCAQCSNPTLRPLHTFPSVTTKKIDGDPARGRLRGSPLVAGCGDRGVCASARELWPLEFDTELFLEYGPKCQKSTWPKLGVSTKSRPFDLVVWPT